MTLYVSPCACSMSCHIAFEEAKLKFEPMISKWDEVKKFNPQGAVPVLQLDDGKILTQNLAILTYAADLSPASDLLPKVGTFERAETYKWASFVASDLHPAFSPLFGEDTPENERKESVDYIYGLLDIAEAHLTGKTYLAAEHFTIADAYMFTVYNWTRGLKIPTDKYRNLNAYAGRIAERPAVQAVMKREGLLK